MSLIRHTECFKDTVMKEAGIVHTHAQTYYTHSRIKGVHVHVYLCADMAHTLPFCDKKKHIQKMYIRKESFLQDTADCSTCLLFFSPSSSSLHFSCVCSSYSQQTRVCYPKYKNRWTWSSSNKMNFPTAKFMPGMRYLCWLYYYQHRVFDLTDSLLYYSMSCSAMLAQCWCNSRLHSNMPSLIELV